MDASVVLRNILLILHIISAGIWISSFPIGLILTRVAKHNPGPGPAAGVIGMVRGELSQMMGQIGGIGILITGLGLIGVDKYGFLGIGGFTPAWLMIKQIIFLVLLVLGVFVMAPMGVKLTKQMTAARAGGAPPAETQAIMKRLTTLGYVVNLLVLINIALAVWKQPF